MRTWARWLATPTTSWSCVTRRPRSRRPVSGWGVLMRLGLELHPEKTRVVDSSWTPGLRLPGVSPAQTPERADLGAARIVASTFSSAGRPSARWRGCGRACATCPRGPGATRISGAAIADLLSGAPGLGPGLSHGNAATHFIDMDTCTSGAPTAPLADQARRPYASRRQGLGGGIAVLRGLGALSPARHDLLSRGWRMPRPEVHLVSRVRKIPQARFERGSYPRPPSAQPTGHK